MREAIANILAEVSKASNDDERVAILQRNDHIGLRRCLMIMFDKNIKWLLPEGDPPYTPNRYPDQDGNFYAEIRRLYLFMEGGNKDLSQLKREQLFVQMLEYISQQDAKLLLMIKDHKQPDGVTVEVVNRAFPGLIPQGEQVG